MIQVLITVGDNGSNHQPSPLMAEADWRLTLKLGAATYTYSLAELKQLGESQLPFEIECVSSGFIAGRNRSVQFSGLLLARLLGQHILPQGSASVIFRSKAPAAIGPEPRHHTSIDLDYCLGPNLLLAWGMNGAPLPYQNGWPLRSIVGPDRYFYKAIKWLDEIELSDKPVEACPGTWEAYGGYHNRGRTGQKPEERFECVMRLMTDPSTRESVAVTSDEWLTTFEQLFSQGNLSRLILARGELLGVSKKRDFSQIRFSDRGFCAQIRGTQFVDCQFSGAQLHGVNLSLCEFKRCKFNEGGHPADLSACDLEGTKIWGNDLSGVKMQGAVLTNCAFYPPKYLSQGKKTESAQVRGLDLRNVVNLDALQAQWLEEDGAILR